MIVFLISISSLVNGIIIIIIMFRNRPNAKKKERKALMVPFVTVTYPESQMNKSKQL